MKVIEVIWIDSGALNNNWLLKEDNVLIDTWENFKPITVHTYGIEVLEDDNYIIIAQNYGFYPEQCCNLMSIPKGCIKETKVLKEI